MKKFFSVILSIFFTVGLLVTFLFNIVRTNISPSRIMDLGAEVIKSMAAVPAYEDDGLYHPDQKVIRTVSFNYEDMEGLDFENLDLAEIIQEIAAENGIDIKIDDELVAELLKDPDTKNLVDDVMNQAVDYMTGKSTALNIDVNKVESVVEKSIKTIEVKTGTKIEYDPQELRKEISDGLEEVVPMFTEAMDEAKEEYGTELEQALTALGYFSMKNLLICIGVLIVIAALIFAINMNLFIMFRYISIPAIVAGVLYLLIAFSGNFITTITADVLKEILSGVVEPVTVLIKNILKQFMIYGFGSLVTGIILCVTGFTAKTK